MYRILLSFVFICVSFIALKAQTKENTSEKPKNAFIKIINACDTSQVERWRTGLDLRFKNQPIGSDIRLGERGPIGRISYIGRDFIEIFRHGDNSESLARIPAQFQENGFYTLVVLGEIDASSSNINVHVIEEYPLPPSSEKPGQCRVIFLNAVKSYPISLSIGTNKARSLAFGEKFETFFPPGEIDIGLWFQDQKHEMRRLQSGMIAEPDGNYTAVIHPSQERGDRPSFFRTNAAEDRTNITEVIKVHTQNQ